MSSTPSISPYGEILIHPRPMLSAAHAVPSSSPALRRWPTMRQGHALESLGHAIEYLYDSQVYQTSGTLSSNDVEAIEILMRLSREIFVECREVVPSSRGIHRGIRNWLLRLRPEQRSA